MKLQAQPSPYISLMPTPPPIPLNTTTLILASGHGTPTE